MTDTRPMDVRAWIERCLAGDCVRVMMRNASIPAFEAEVRTVLGELGVTEREFLFTQEHPDEVAFARKALRDGLARFNQEDAP